MRDSPKRQRTVERIEKVVPHIRLREQDASKLFIYSNIFITIYLKGVDEVRARNNFQSIIHFYQIDDIKPRNPKRIKASHGGGMSLTAVDFQKADADSLQLIMLFIEWAKNYLEQIASKLEELQKELEG